MHGQSTPSVHFTVLLPGAGGSGSGGLGKGI